MIRFFNAFKIGALLVSGFLTLVSAAHATEDISPPTIRVTSILETQQAPSSTSVELTGVVTDDVAVASVFVRVTDLTSSLVWEESTRSWAEGSTTWNRATFDTTGHWTFNFRPPMNTYGKFLVTAIAFDTSSKIGVSTRPQKTFSLRTADSLPPEISVAMPVNEHPSFTRFPVTLSGELHDDAQVVSVLIRITNLETGNVWDEVGRRWVAGSTHWNPATSFDQRHWSYEFNPYGVTNGTFMVTAIVINSQKALGVSPAPQRQFIVSGAVDPAAVVFEGGSLIYGAGAVHGLNDFPSQLCGQLVSRDAFQCVNSGAGGAKIHHLVSDGPTRIDSLRRSDNMLVVWVGTNDLFQGGVATDMYENLTHYIRDRQIAGWRVAVLTLPPMNMSVAKGGAQADSERMIFNSLLRSNAANADLVIDVDGIPEFQDWTNGRYRIADGIHFFPAGYALIADLVRPYVEGRYF